MVIYDAMLTRGLRPDDNLNRVLVYVCNIDPISVIWNSGPDAGRGLFTRPPPPPPPPPPAAQQAK
jgi:hypothetical protein